MLSKCKIGSFPVLAIYVNVRDEDKHEAHRLELKSRTRYKTQKAPLA